MKFLIFAFTKEIKIELKKKLDSDKIFTFLNSALKK